MLKVSFGQLKPTRSTYARAALAWTKKKSKKPRSLINKHKANRASETEEQRKERLRIRCEKDRTRRRTKKLQEGKKVVRNRRPRETAPGHSEKIEARCKGNAFPFQRKTGK